MHPPDQDRPVRPWLATVPRNRWRHGSARPSRREVREQIAVVENETERPDTLIDRARVLEKLAAALVALDEPFRAVVMKRYLDGKTAAQIARALGVPAGTVRWRLKTGLERLRAALDESTPRWKRLPVPLAAVKGAVAVKAKTSLIALVVPPPVRRRRHRRARRHARRQDASEGHADHRRRDDRQRREAACARRRARRAAGLRRRRCRCPSRCPDRAARLSRTSTHPAA